LNIDIFVVGEDWGNPHNIEVESYLKTEGRKIVQVSYSPRTSSSVIKNNVRAQAHILAVPSSSRTAPIVLAQRRVVTMATENE
jgi:glyoxylate carboligase